MNQSATSRQNAPRRYATLWLIIGLLLLPFVLAGALYVSGWRPAAAPRGEVLFGADQLPVKLPTAAFAGHWGLVLVSPGQCEDRCLADLDSLRRIHVALYKQMPQVRRLWVSDQASAIKSVEALHTRWPDLSVVADHAGVWQTLLKPAAGKVTGNTQKAAGGNPGAAAVFVIAPDGQAVLRFSAPFEPRDVLHDMSRLLRRAYPT